jgi:uncharacterized membrane protein YeaQ/YmgE (transglycosylase-associated protein family)
MFWSLVGLFFLGLVVGFLARLLVRSPARLGCIGTAILGIIGSYAGGSLGSILFHDKFDLRKAGTFVGALAGTVVVLALWRVVDGSRGRISGRR